MARYTGPKTKIARKFGEAIFGEDKSFEKRNYREALGQGFYPGYDVFSIQNLDGSPSLGFVSKGNPGMRGCMSSY